MKKIVTFIVCSVIALVVSITIFAGTQQEEINAKSHVRTQINRQYEKKDPSTDNFILLEQDSTDNFTEHVEKIENENDIEKKENIDYGKSNEEIVSEEKEITKLSHDKIVELTEGFDALISIIMEDMDENFRLLNYSTRDEIEKEFLEYAQQGVATPYIDTYFEEIDGVLYGLPQDGPAWFDKETEYTLETLSNGKVLLSQNNYNELDGTYTIKMEFENTSNQWKISNVSIN